MKSYRYDGSYEGFLCTLEAAMNESAVGDIWRDEVEEGLSFNEVIEVTTDLEKAKSYSDFLREQLDGRTISYLYYAHLAEGKHVPYLLYEYIRFGLEEAGVNLNRHMSHRIVHQVHGLRGQVLREKQRFLGLVRFSQLESGIFYSKISPDHRVLGILGSHFSDRLPNERWMIHDIRRNWALLGQGKKRQMITLAAVDAPEENDEFIQNLWQQYHGHVAILGRTNARQQKGYMPKRYWEHLPEKPGEARQIQEENKRKYGK